MVIFSSVSRRGISISLVRFASVSSLSGVGFVLRLPFSSPSLRFLPQICFRRDICHLRPFPFPFVAACVLPLPQCVMFPVGMDPSSFGRLSNYMPKLNDIPISCLSRSLPTDSVCFRHRILLWFLAFFALRCFLLFGVGPISDSVTSQCSLDLFL